MIVFQGLRPGNVRSPSGRKQKLFIVHQGLRPWQRSCALRAEREGVHCPPGTASLATFVRPPGGETEVIHCPAGTSSLATLVRPPGGKRRCSLPTRDFVPGNVRAPSGRGNRSCSLPTRDYVPGNVRRPPGENTRCSLSALRGGSRSCWLSTRGTASLATFARPPGGTERRFRAPAPHQLVIY